LKTRLILTTSSVLMLLSPTIASAQHVRQTRAVELPDESVAPPVLGSVRLVILPDDDEPPRSLPISTSLRFVGGDTLSITSTRIGANLPIFVSGADLTSKGGSELLVAANVNFGASVLDSKTMLDVPETLFSTGGGVTALKQLNDRWRMLASVNVAYQGDGEAEVNIITVSGVGMLQWQKTETTQWTFGVAVTGQDNFPVIPLVSVTCKPREDWEVSLGLPRTRIAHKVNWFGPQHDMWLYTGLLGVGGGTYGVRRADGLDDQLTINEFPIALGLEKRGDGPKYFVETGIVVGRAIEYEVSGETENVGEGFYARFGLSY